MNGCQTTTTKLLYIYIYIHICCSIMTVSIMCALLCFNLIYRDPCPMLSSLFPVMLALTFYGCMQLSSRYTVSRLCDEKEKTTTGIKRPNDVFFVKRWRGESSGIKNKAEEIRQKKLSLICYMVCSYRWPSVSRYTQEQKLRTARGQPS